MLRNKLLNYLELKGGQNIKKLFDLYHIDVRKKGKTFSIQVLGSPIKMVREGESYLCMSNASIDQGDRILLRDFVSECFNVKRDEVILEDGEKR